MLAVVVVVGPSLEAHKILLVPLPSLTEMAFHPFQNYSGQAWRQPTTHVHSKGERKERSLHFTLRKCQIPEVSGRRVIFRASCPVNENVCCGSLGEGAKTEWTYLKDAYLFSDQCFDVDRIMKWRLLEM